MATDTAGASGTKRKQSPGEAADEGADNVEYDEFDDLSDCVEELLAAVPSPIKSAPSPKKPERGAQNVPSIGVNDKHTPPTSPGNESDDFGDLDLEDIDFDDSDDLLKPQQTAKHVNAISPQPESLKHANDQSHQGAQAIQRYLILDVADSTYVTERGQRRPEKVCIYSQLSYDHLGSQLGSGFACPRGATSDESSSCAPRNMVR